MRIRKKRASPLLIVLIALLLLCQRARAQSLVDLFNVARDNDPAVEAGKAEYDASDARVTEARAYLMPGVSANGAGSFSRFSPFGQSNPGQDYHYAQWTLQVAQSVYQPQYARALDEAKKQRDASGVLLDSAESDLLNRLLGTYFDALSAREVRLALIQQEHSTEEQMQSAKRSFDEGASAITDVRDAEAKHDLVVAQVVQAEDDLALKREALMQLVGIDRVALRVLPHEASVPEIKDLRLAKLIDQALDQSPDVRQAQLLLEAARLEVRKQQGGHLPTLGVSLSYGSDATNGSASQPFPVYGTTMTAQATLTVPIFSGFGIDAKVREAQAMQSKAQSDVDKAEKTVRSTVREAYYGLQSALGQVQSLKTAETSSTAAVLANRKGATVGANTTQDVLNAESQFFQAHRDLVKAKLDAWLNYIKLQIALGDPWRAGIESVDRLLVPEEQLSNEPLQLVFMESYDGRGRVTQEVTAQPR